MTSLLPLFIMAALITLAATPLVRGAAHRLGTLDHPAAHKPHLVSVPRLGGVAIALAWFGTISGGALIGVLPESSMPDAPLPAILLGSLIVCLLGLWDDTRPLAPVTKVLGEVVAAAIVVGAGIVIERATLFGTTWQLGWFDTAVTVLWIVGITNAFNLMDGLDGLATGLAIIAGVTCAAIVIIRGDYGTAALLVALVGAQVGFLPFNFNPASIFMGDSGSLLTGFVLAVTSITGSQKGATALALGVPVLIFALPIVDTVSAAIRRLLQPGGLEPDGRHAFARLTQPDRQHIHHRLMALGLSHRDTVLVLYAVALCLSAVALMTIDRP